MRALFSRSRGGQRRHVQNVPVMRGHPVAQAVVRNNVDVQFRGKLNEPLGQRGLANPGAGHCAAAQHNFGHPGQAGKFGNLIGHIVPIDRLHRGAQLLRQTNVGLKTLFIRRGHPLGRLCLHKQGRKLTAKGPRHPRGHAENPLIGRSGGKAHQNMLPGTIFHAPAVGLGI